MPRHQAQDPQTEGAGRMLRRLSWLAISCAAAAIGGAVGIAEEKKQLPAALAAPLITPQKLDLKVVVPKSLTEPKSEPANESETGAHGAGQGNTAPDKPPESPEEKPVEKSPEPPVPTEWLPAEILAEEAKCKALLATADVLAIPEPPFRSGPCGAPAPVRVISVGKDPEVALDPPPLLTCAMAASLALWIKKDLQPLAQKHLGERVIKIATMSDYSCRAAYGRKGNRLSEHGRANALDIRGFTTAKGKFSSVLTDWGMTQRDVARAIAAAKAAAEKAEKERAEAEAAAAAKIDPNVSKVPVTGSAPKDPTRESLADRSVVEGTEKPSPEKATPPSKPESDIAPASLGAPKPVKSTAVAPEPIIGPQPLSKSGTFLREAHASACRVFGTTLGPEANEAHRNHFHLDMAERKDELKICDD
jgi:hypothetical protein